MATQKTSFPSNRSQAVRLPKAVAFDSSVREVTSPRAGPRRIIVPIDAAWTDFFAAPGTDLGEREQPSVQVRDGF